MFRWLVYNNFSISNTYTAYANAVSAQPGKGVRLEAITIEGNVAYAETNVTANSGIHGSGSIDAGSGAVTVTMKGTARAKADIQSQDFSASVVDVAVNIVTAKVSGNQRAKIEGATVEAGSVTVQSEFNTDSSDDNYAATAKVGSGSGTKMSLVGGEASTANASVTAASG